MRSQRLASLGRRPGSAVSTKTPANGKGEGPSTVRPRTGARIRLAKSGRRLEFWLCLALVLSRHVSALLRPDDGEAMEVALSRGRSRTQPAYFLLAWLKEEIDLALPFVTLFHHVLCSAEPLNQRANSFCCVSRHEPNQPDASQDCSRDVEVL